WAAGPHSRLSARPPPANARDTQVFASAYLQCRFHVKLPPAHFALEPEAALPPFRSRRPRTQSLGQFPVPSQPHVHYPPPWATPLRRPATRLQPAQPGVHIGQAIRP